MNLMLFSLLAFGAASLATDALRDANLAVNALASNTFAPLPHTDATHNYERALPGDPIEPVVDSPPDSDADVPVKITLGNYVTNVGAHAGPDLHDIIFQALDNIGKSYDNHGPAIEYIDVGQQYFEKVMLKDDKLEITIDGHKWATEAQRKLMAEAVAGAAMRSADDAKNCYTWTVFLGRLTGPQGRFCAIPSFISIQYGRYFMNAKFDAANVGNFDCVAIMGSVKSFLNGLLPHFSDEMSNVPVYAVVDCPVKTVTHGEME